jgi:hypothetical protein
MILSNSEIHRALDDGRLVLDPEPLPKIPDESGPECPYQTSAVDLRLGNEISYFTQGLPVNVDLRQGGFAPICQLIVETVQGVPFRNDSQFHGQEAAGGVI